MRKVIKGTTTRPRLVVFRSNRYIYAQTVDDSAGRTVAAVERAADEEKAGREMAGKLEKAGVKSVVFDRAGYQYHGRVKRLAEAVREAGVRI
jgi:large subunit ribosomal protein L18